MIALSLMSVFRGRVQGRLRMNLWIDYRRGSRRDWQPRSTDDSDRRHLRSGWTRRHTAGRYFIAEMDL